MRVHRRRMGRVLLESGMTQSVEGQMIASGMRFGIVLARFNGFMTEGLLSGALDAILRHGGSEKNITTLRVPGSYEIPLALKKLAETNRFDALIALGAVIRGATLHYELICHSVTQGIMQLSLESGLPITYGIITADTIEQAIERSGSKAGNKGAEAALAAIEMVSALSFVEKLQDEKVRGLNALKA